MNDLRRKSHLPDADRFKDKDCPSEDEPAKRSGKGRANVKASPQRQMSQSLTQQREESVITDSADLKSRIKTAVRSTSEELRDETDSLDADLFRAEELFPS